MRPFDEAVQRRKSSISSAFSTVVTSRCMSIGRFWTKLTCNPASKGNAAGNTSAKPLAYTRQYPRARGPGAFICNSQVLQEWYHRLRYGMSRGHGKETGEGRYHINMSSAINSSPVHNHQR